MEARIREARRIALVLDSGGNRARRTEHPTGPAVLGWKSERDGMPGRGILPRHPFQALVLRTIRSGKLTRADLADTIADARGALPGTVAPLRKDCRTQWKQNG